MILRLLGSSRKTRRKDKTLVKDGKERREKNMLGDEKEGKRRRWRWRWMTYQGRGEKYFKLIRIHCNV